MKETNLKKRYAIRIVFPILKKRFGKSAGSSEAGRPAESAAIARSEKIYKQTTTPAHINGLLQVFVLFRKAASRHLLREVYEKTRKKPEVATYEWG